MTNPLLALKDDPSGRTLGLELPAGRLIDGTADGPWPEPLLWCAADAGSGGASVADPRWQRAGLYPVMLDCGRRPRPDRLWDGELMPGESSAPGSFHAEDVLRSWWSAYGRGRWPGTAPGTEGERAGDPPAVVGERVAQLLVAHGVLRTPRLGLVPAARGADVLPAIGWTGPLNYESDMGRYAAVLRSWEDRFGVRVVGLGLNTLYLSVPAPPRTPGEALPIAVEHLAFCPDNLLQSDWTSLDDYARSLVDVDTWGFWWD
ncbi:DUF4253 domain-containing protein [Streptomyces sp. NPDC048650]|uniref:DUF4253 domain-containing protein n=1 Tax=Streptomyces sp. NPDC048650 TaxID=3365583 RepID=UPI003712C158